MFSHNWYFKVPDGVIYFEDYTFCIRVGKLFYFLFFFKELWINSFIFKTLYWHFLFPKILIVYIYWWKAFSCNTWKFVRNDLLDKSSLHYLLFKLIYETWIPLSYFCDNFLICTYIIMDGEVGPQKIYK